MTEQPRLSGRTLREVLSQPGDLSAQLLDLSAQLLELVKQLLELVKQLPDLWEQFSGLWKRHIITSSHPKLQKFKIYNYAYGHEVRSTA